MPKKKRILILGAGISGLTAAWELTKRGYECAILEKKRIAGGYICTEEQEGIFLEKGPRVFHAAYGQHLLALIEEMGLSHEVRLVDDTSRYLLLDHRLHKVPSSFGSLLGSSLGRTLLRALWRERKIPPSKVEESIWEFGLRRFGSAITETLLDALVAGIYAGDYRTLSMSACFPRIKEMEQTYGSLVRGAFSKQKKKGASLFTLARGGGSLISALSYRLRDHLFLDQEIHAIHKKDDLSWEVATSGGAWQGDVLVSALPAKEISRLLAPFSREGSRLLQDIPYRGMWLVHVVFTQQIQLPRGVGYLVPRKEQEPLLGVLFDSQLAGRTSPVQMTLFFEHVQASVKRLTELTYRYLHAHLGIHFSPDKLFIDEVPFAIPQYLVGHQRRIETVRASLPQGVHLIGNYLDGGISVNDCIASAVREINSIN